MDAYRLAEQRSLAYHRRIAERLPGEPGLLALAGERVSRWLADGRAPHYARAWNVLLAGPVEALCALLVADTEEARALRQATPFAGALDPRERWRIWREVRDAARETPG